jgi:hypothetical protein
VRYSLEYLLNFDFLIREFKKREIGKVIFKNTIRPEDMQIFLKAFIAAGFSDTPYETMSDMTSETEGIELYILMKIREGEDVDARKVIK